MSEKSLWMHKSNSQGRNNHDKKIISEQIDSIDIDSEIVTESTRFAQMLLDDQGSDIVTALEKSGVSASDIELVFSLLVSRSDEAMVSWGYGDDVEKRPLSDLSQRDFYRAQNFNYRLGKILKLLALQGKINIQRVLLDVFDSVDAKNEEKTSVMSFVDSQLDPDVQSDESTIIFFESIKGQFYSDVLTVLLAKHDYNFILKYESTLSLSSAQISFCIDQMVANGELTQLIELARYRHIGQAFITTFKENVLEKLSIEQYIALLEPEDNYVVPYYFLDEEKIMQHQFTDTPKDRDLIKKILYVSSDLSEACVQYLARQLSIFDHVADSPFFVKSNIVRVIQQVDLSRPIFTEHPDEAMNIILQFPWLQADGNGETEWEKMPIGLPEERQATLNMLLQKVPTDHQEAFIKRFNEQGITDGQMKSWLGRRAFKAPDEWTEAVIGDLMFTRLQNRFSHNIHDASYFLSHFQAPESLKGDDSEIVKKRKSYNATAQRWLKNNISTPAETLVLAWQNRDAALVDGCADNPSAIILWTKANAVRRVLDGFSFDEAPNRSVIEAFLIETVRQTSPEKAVDIFRRIQLAHNIEALLRPVRIDLGNGYIGEIFRKDDPRGTTIGADTGCCMSVGGASESCIIAGYTDPRYGFFGLYRQGELIAQSFLYTNPEQAPGVLVCDNIEANKARDLKKILDLYQKFFTLYGAASPVSFSQIYVGEGYSSIGLHDLSEVDRLKRSMSPLPIYTDAEKQRLLASVQITPSQASESIQWLDSDPVARFNTGPIAIDWEADDDEDEDGDDDDGF